jgi:hypothetical protein
MGKLLFLLINFANADYICQIESGDVGKFKYRADTMLEAMTKTSTACSDARMELYRQLRGEEPSTGRKILFIESCTNANMCWETK